MSDAAPQTPYHQKTVVELRDELKKRNLIKTGKKEELIQRLLNDDEGPSGKAASTVALMKTPYSKLTVAQLQTELKKRDLPTDGVKVNLVERLVAFEEGKKDEQEPEEEIPEETSLKFRKYKSPPPKFLKRESSGKLSSSRGSTRIAELTSDGSSLAPEDLKLYKHPIDTLKYFFLAVNEWFWKAFNYSSSHYILLGALSVVVVLYEILRSYPSSYQPLIFNAESWILWYSWWVVLGIASSIGLGTGLHTFVLYLGPHIARMTMFVYNCYSLEYEVLGPNSYNCIPGKRSSVPITILDVYKTIMFEAFFWGAGTAIGELPPYFVARGAALAGRDDEELDHIEELKKKPAKDLTFLERLQLFMLNLLERFGFFGIFVAASIPNPLFDLAGITCGHFLIPFYTFFGATFLGKAFVKAGIQALATVFVFSKDSIEILSRILEDRSPKLFEYASKILNEQKADFDRNDGGKFGSSVSSSSLVSSVWNGVVTLMVLYFLLSIVESLAQGHMKKMAQTAKNKSKK